MRTASMTKQEAVNLIGSRSMHPSIDSQNRAIVIKWLSAQGVPAILSKSMGLDALRSAYYSETGYNVVGHGFIDGIVDDDSATAKPEPEPDLGNILAAIIAEPAEPAPEPEQSSLLPIPEPEPEPAPEPEPVDSGISSKDAARQIQEILDNVAGKLDESRVIELIEKHSAKPRQSIITIKDKFQGTTTTLPDELRHHCFEDSLRTLSANVNLMLVGGAGAGKSHMGKQLASALDIPFYMTSAIDGAHKLNGFIDAQGRIIEPAFRKAYENGGLFMFDEMDSSLPQAIMAFNGALANGTNDFPDKNVNRHEDFHAIACTNTYCLGASGSYNARFRLDGATRDRFFFLGMPYDESLESALCGVEYTGAAFDSGIKSMSKLSPEAWLNRVRAIRRAVETAGIELIVSPRASLGGIALAETGMNRGIIEEGIIWKGIDSDSRSKIEAAI